MRQEKIEGFEQFLEGLEGQEVSIDINTTTSHITNIELKAATFYEDSRHYIVEDNKNDKVNPIYIEKDLIKDIIFGFEDVGIECGMLIFTIARN